MLINVSEGEECRIALLEDGKLEELYMERSSSTSHVGNIYKGKVTNVEASIQAAFVDFGLGRNGFLHISDLMPTYFGQGGGEIHESVGRKMSRRDRPPIQRCLRRGDELIVQIIKEGIGTKGPTLSTYVSIPGRILVMMPGMGKFGVSRKIEDDDERRRLRTILDSLKPLKDVGFIIRTAGIGKSKTDIQRDLTYLTRLWQTIEKKMQSGKGPMELYTEGDLVTRTVRDVFTNDIERVIIDSKDVAKRVKEVIKLSNPRTRNKVELYEDPVPLFHSYGIEREIEQMYSRHVPLPSGGSLVIDSTEAVVAIDVNSGKFRDHSDAEMTAFKTDMEAADEIPRQLKLRDLGGVIICDFIDLRYERNRRELEKRLHDNLRDDRAKTKVLRMSQFGIIEMTRQRMRPSLKRSIYFDCPHCKGAGLVKTPESMTLDVMRRLAIAVNDQRVVRVELTVAPEVASYLLNKKRGPLADLEDHAKKRVLVLQDPKLSLDDVNFELFDLRDGMVYLDELGMSPAGPGEEKHGRGRGEQRGGRDQNRGRPQQTSQGAKGSRPPSIKTRPVDDDFEEHDRDEFDNEPGEASEPARQRPAARTAAPTRKADPVDVEDDFDGDDSEEESQVVEVDDPSEPLGEGPRGFEEDDRRDYRGRPNQSARNNNRQQQNQPPRNRPPLPPRDNRMPGGAPNVLPNGAPNDGPRDENDGDENGPRRRRRRGRRGRGGRGRGRGQGETGAPMNDGAIANGQGNGPGDDFGHEDDREEGPNGNVAERLPLDDADELDRPTSVTSETTVESYGSGEVETESIEATFEGEESSSNDERAVANTDGENGEQRPRRRRRRGGRRHRRRRELATGAPGGEGAPASEELETDAGNEDAVAVDDDAEVDDEPIGDAPAEILDDDVAVEDKTEVEAEAVEAPVAPPAKPSRAKRAPSGRARPQRKPPTPRESKKAAVVAVTPEIAPVVKTGSTDKHLIHDADAAPIDPDPPRRPQSYRDLDDIPDDFD